MKDKLALIFIVILGLMFYSLTLRGVLGNPKPSDIKNNLDQVTKPLELSPERGRFANIMALGDSHRYDLGTQLANAVYPDVGQYRGKFFSYFAPGLAYIGLPFYQLGKHFNLSLVSTFGFVSLVSILDLLLLFVIARNILHVPRWAAVFAVLIFAFATTSWSYAVTLYQHMLTVFFILSSFYAVWQYSRQNRYSWGWGAFVWLSYALAISIDYPNAVLMLPVMVYFAITSVRVARTAAGYAVAVRPALFATGLVFAAIMIIHGYHNKVNFGSWTSLSGQLPQYELAGATAQAGSNQAVSQISAKEGLNAFFHESNVPFGFYTLTVSPDRGLFVFCPVLLLGFLSMFMLRKRMTLEVGVLLALVGVNMLLYSSWGDPWGGWAFGPRYLIPSMSILSLLAAVWAAQVRRQVLGKLIAFVLFAYSSAVALLGVLTTNAVPPKVEAMNLHSRYGFLFDWKFFMQGKSGSLLFNAYFSHLVTLQKYYVMIYGAVMLIVLFALFVMPLWEDRISN